jgi:hypothetical protein
VASRASIANVFTGGMKLIATLNEEFGAWPMNCVTSHDAVVTHAALTCVCRSRCCLSGAPPGYFAVLSVGLVGQEAAPPMCM